MDTVLRKTTSIRLEAELFDKIKQLAKANQESFNKFVEGLLSDAVYHEPNEETLAAIEEARSGVELETLDLDHFEAYVKSL